MAESKINPWGRQNDETSEAFELFNLFLRLRSVTEVAREYFAKDGATEGALVAGRSYCARLKKEHHWEARCLAYDRWVLSIREGAIKDQTRQEVALFSQAKIRIVKNLVKHMNRIDRKLDKLHAAEEKKLQTEKSEDKPDKIAETLHIGSFNMFASAAKTVLGEIRELEKSNPLEAKDDKNKDHELNSALDRLNEIIAKREAGENKKGEAEILQ